MKRDKALRLAVAALRKQAQRLAVDANLHDVYHADYPHAVNASQERKLLLEAIEELEHGAEQAALPGVGE